MTLRFFIASLSAISFSVLAGTQPSSAEVDVHIGINIPPPPQIVFEREPPVVIVPQTDVYYVPEASGYDMYRYGAWWYVNRDGYWYRSRDYRGPFGVIEYGRVPRHIIGLPQDYHRYPVRPRKHAHDRHHHGRDDHGRRSGDAPRGKKHGHDHD